MNDAHRVLLVQTECEEDGVGKFERLGVSLAGDGPVVRVLGVGGLEV